MGLNNHFICEAEFIERADVCKEADAYKIRMLLAVAPLSTKGAKAYGKCLQELWKKTWNEQDPFFHATDAYLLGKFLHFIDMNVDEMQEQIRLLSRHTDVEGVVQFGFDAMLNYGMEEHARQGLKFIQIYCRTYLEQAASFDLTTASLEVFQAIKKQIHNMLYQSIVPHPTYVSMLEQGLGPMEQILDSVVLPELEMSV